MRLSTTVISLLVLVVFLPIFPIVALTAQSHIEHANSAETPLTYRVEALPNAQPSSIRVTLSFTSANDTATTIVFPSNWGGPLFVGISNIEVLSDGATLRDTDTNFVKIIHHKPGSPVSLRYVVRETRSGEITLGNRFLPVIRPDVVFVLGHGYLAHPRVDEHAPRRFTVEWVNLPSGWTLSTPFGTTARQEFTASIWQIKHAVYSAGMFRTITLQVHDKPATLSLRGNYDFSDSELVRVVQLLLNAQRELWQDFDIPHYSLVALAIDTDDPAGSSFYSSSILFLPEGQELDLRLKKLISHELFHYWVGGKIVRSQPEDELLWFSEGFPNYYARLTLLRSGLVTVSEYAEDYNSVLERYYTSPVRAIPNRELARDFYRNSDVNRLPYQRGDILAHHLNAAIRSASNGSNSLDNAMRELLQTVSTANELLTHEHLLSVLRTYQVHDAPALLQSAVYDGKLIEADGTALGPGFKVVLSERKKYLLFGESFKVWTYEPNAGNTQDSQSWFLQ